MTLKSHYSLCYANLAVLCLNGTLYRGPAMVPLDTAMRSSCRLSFVTMSIRKRFGRNFNATFLPPANTHVCRITISFPSVDCSVRHSSVTIACMGLQSLWKIAFFPRPNVGCWPSDISCTVDSP